MLDNLLLVIKCFGFEFANTHSSSSWPYGFGCNCAGIHIFPFLTVLLFMSALQAIQDLRERFFGSSYELKSHDKVRN